MKLHLALFLVFLWFGSWAQTQRTTFRLTDTSFSAYAIYRPTCDVISDYECHNDLQPKSCLCLDSFADFMLAHPEIIIEIGAHTDQRGSDTFNIKLSQTRANSVLNYLLKKGVFALKLAAVGYGETQLINSDSIIRSAGDPMETERLYRQNRRIEFKIIHLDKATFTPGAATFVVGAVYRPFILFDLAKATIRPESKLQLDSLADFLNRNRIISIEITVHSDARASKKYSTCITCARARSINDSLVARGVDQSRITYKGWSDQQPLISTNYINRIPSLEGREQLHAINRRTEIRIVQINRQ